RAVGSLSVGGAEAGYREGSPARRQAAFSGSFVLAPQLRAGFGWSGYRAGDAFGTTRFASLSGLAGALPWTLSGWSSSDVDAAQERDAASGQLQLFVAAPLGGGRRLDQSLQLKGDRSRVAPATASLSYRAALVTPTAGEFDASADWSLAPGSAERGPTLSAGWRGSLTRRLSAHLFVDGAGGGATTAPDLGGSFSYALGRARQLTFGLEFPHAGDWSDVKASLGFSADFDLPLGRKANVGRVSGRVVDAAGRGLAGLIVDVDGRSVLTADDGAYDFPAIPPGEHFLSIQPDSLGPTRVTQPESPLHFTMAPKQAVEYDFTVYAAGSISGRLTAVQSDQSALAGVVVGTGGADAGGPSCAGVALTLRQAGAARVLHATTDADGRFRFDHLPPGEWRLAVDGETLPEGYRLDRAVPAIKLAEGEAAAIDVRLNPIVRAIDFAPGGTLELSVGS
ncbi:MAG TPA: carboxypeptidase-like regulatory domain-containing protein, partial [Limnochordia bacterium]|nr:carboxypeptidase-like regulatory domain-containing protein [Limnochordia bacterium]